jgi:hypothetical protein
VPLAQVRDLLGRASITTTERYDNQKLENLQIAAAQLETGMTFEPAAAFGAQSPAHRSRQTRSSRAFPPKAEATRPHTSFKNLSSTRVCNFDRAPFARCPRSNLTN